MSFPQYNRYKDSSAEWIGQVPEHWTVSRLGFEADTVVPMRDKPEPLDGDIPWIRIEDFDGKYISRSKSGQGVSNEIVQAMNLKVLPPGAVLCSCSCNMGATAIVASPITTNQTFIGIIPHNGLRSDFLYYLFIAAAEHLNSVGTGAIQTYLSRDDFRQLRFPRPSLNEQTSIVEFLDSETKKIDSLIEEQRRLIELLKEKRQAIISHAVTKGLNPDAPMKHSGYSELGAIPSHWRSGTLRRFATRIVVGLAEATTQAYADDGIPILRATNIRPGRIEGELLRIDPDFSQERDSKTLKAGDLVTVRTGYPGVTAVIPGELDGCHCFTMLITSLASKQNPQFFCYFLNSNTARQYFDVEGWGSAQTNISVPILQDAPVPAPPPDEQASIVEYLDHREHELGNLIGEAERAIELLRERRSALISAAVTGKIDVRRTVAECVA